jgi:hypothetical protein
VRYPTGFSNCFPQEASVTVARAMSAYFIV